MTLPNDSILVTPGSGATLATQLVSAKEYEAWVRSNESGGIAPDPLGVWASSFNDAAGGVSSSDVDRFSILNGDATLILEIVAAWSAFAIASFPPVISTSTRLSRITAHSGGTARTPVKVDTTTSALDADIVVRSRPASVTRTGDVLLQQRFNIGNASHSMSKTWVWNEVAMGFPIVCRQNEGVVIHDISEFTSGGGTAFDFGFVFRVR